MNSNKHTAVMRDFALAWQNAPHGGKEEVLQRAMQHSGLSRATVYRQFVEIVGAKPRKQRSDAGKSALAHYEAYYIGAVLKEQAEQARLNGGKFSIRAKVLSKKTGEWEAVSITTILRALRRYGYHPEQWRTPKSPADIKPFASLPPDHVWKTQAATGFGQRLQAVRERLGLKQAGLAMLLKVEVQTVQEWETESSLPQMKHLAELAKMGVDVPFLLSGQPPPAAADALTDGERFILYCYRCLTQPCRNALYLELIRLAVLLKRAK